MVHSCKLVYASFGHVDQFSVAAVDCYERALSEAEQNGTKVRAFVLTNPHNPLGTYTIVRADDDTNWTDIIGQCYPRDTLEAIFRFCNKHRLHLISDEIYACSVYRTDTSSPGFTSALSLDTTDVIDSSLVHVMYGMSKASFGCVILMTGF